MKKIITILLLVFCADICIASETTEQPYSKNQVVLNTENEHSIFDRNRNVKKGYVEEDNLNLKYTKDLREESHNTLLYKDVNRLQPEKQSYSKTLDKTIAKNTTIGTTYNATEKSGEMNDSVSVFSKYQKDKFSFTSAYGQNRAGYKENGVGGGTVSFTPKLAINKHLSVKNVYSDNTTTKQTSNEVVLSVKPFKDDRMDVDLGAGQTFSQDNQPAKSQLNLSTKFRF